MFRAYDTHRETPPVASPSSPCRLGVEYGWAVGNVRVLVLCHLWQRVVRLQDGEGLAEERQGLALQQLAYQDENDHYSTKCKKYQIEILLQWIRDPVDALPDGVDREVPLVEVPAQVVKGLLAQGRAHACEFRKLY